MFGLLVYPENMILSVYFVEFRREPPWHKSEDVHPCSSFAWPLNGWFIPTLFFLRLSRMRSLIRKRVFLCILVEEISGFHVTYFYFPVVIVLGHSSSQWRMFFFCKTIKINMLAVSIMTDVECDRFLWPQAQQSFANHVQLVLRDVFHCWFTCRL